MSEQSMQVLQQLVNLFSDDVNPVSADDLLADLPAEALSGPKTDAQGNTLRTWDAELTGYDAPYVIAEAIRRLGADGWVDVMIYGPPRDGYISRAARDSQTPDAVEIDGDCVCYFPGLHTARIASATGIAKTLGDAKKAAQTTARKRIFASIGIGWRGYTDNKSTLDSADHPQINPPYQPPKPKQTAKPAWDKPQAPAAPAPAQAVKKDRPQASPNKPITEPQHKMITKLLTEKGVTSEMFKTWVGEGRKLADFNAQEASTLIDGLISGNHVLLSNAPPADDDPYGAL